MFLIVSVIIIYGFFLVLPIVDNRNIILAVILAFPIGLILTLVSILLILFIGIPYSLLSIILVLLTSVIIVFLSYYRNNLSNLNKKKILLFSLFLIILSFIISIQNYSVFSYDSFAQISLGKAIAVNGAINNSYIISSLFTWGSILPILQSLSHFFNIDYLPSLSLIIGISFISFFFYIFHVYSNPVKTLVKKNAFSILITTAFFSIYFILFQFFYIHNNFLSSYFLFLFIGLQTISQENGNKQLKILAIIFLVIFALTRIENTLIGLIFLVPIICLIKASYRERVKYTLLYSIPLILWYGKILIIASRFGSFHSDIADPNKIIMMLGAVLIFDIVILLSVHKRIEKLIKYLPKIMVLLTALLVIGITTLKFDHIVRSLNSLSTNMFLTRGNWGVFWFVIIILLFLTIRSKSKTYPYLGYSLITSLLLLLFFVVFRSPFRTGWGDSGNRILIHFAPLIYLLLLDKINGLKYEDQIYDINIMIKIFLIFGVLLLLLLGFLYFGDLSYIQNLMIKMNLENTIFVKYFSYSRSIIFLSSIGFLLLLLIIILKLKKIAVMNLILVSLVVLLVSNGIQFYISNNGEFQIHSRSDNQLLSAVPDRLISKVKSDRNNMAQIKELLGSATLILYDHALIGPLNYMNVGFIVTEGEKSVILEENIDTKNIEFYNLTNSCRIALYKDIEYKTQADVIELPSKTGRDYIIVPR